MTTPSHTNKSLLPLLTTTATLSLAAYETLFFRLFLHQSHQSPTHKSAIARSLSFWWRNSLPSMLPVVLGLITSSLISGIRAYRGISSLQSTRRYVALAGTVFAVAHLAFGVKIANVIQDMAFAYERVGEWRVDADAEEQGRTKEEIADEAVLEGQREWLRVHFLRTMITDLPAWGCFAWLVWY